MISFFQLIHVIVCMLLIGIILIQSGKGQGLAGAFGSFAGGAAHNLFGARTTDVLTKVTAYLALIFFISAFTLAFVQMKQTQSIVRDIKKSGVEKNISNVPTKQAEDMSKKINELTNKLLKTKGTEPSKAPATPAAPSEAPKQENAKPEQPAPASSGTPVPSK